MYLDDIKLTPVEAEALYAGILVDTKNFTFKTGVKTFEVAAYLKRSGLDITEAKQIFKNDFETYIAKVEIVKNAEIIDNKIAISMTDAVHENMPIIAAQAADELLSITGILASFVLCKVDNVVMISGRSMGDINVQMILENMGGGGHLTFAGAQIAGVELEEAKKTLVENINGYFGKNKNQE
ncbi:Bifunctional oligoribonuclease and PAP phosphatase NrnA [compost metagenome]